MIPVNVNARCPACPDLGKLPMVNTLGMNAEQLLERAEAYEREARCLRQKAARLLPVQEWAI